MKYLEDSPHESKESGESKEPQSNEIPLLKLDFPARD
jgi:hypothetical protein